MRVFFQKQFVKSKKLNEWCFMFTPSFFMARSDKISDEAAYYIGFHWLFFRAYAIVITKKKEEEE